MSVRWRPELTNTHDQDVYMALGACVCTRVCACERVVTVSEIGELPFTGHASLVCDVINLRGSLEMSRRKFPSGRKKWIFILLLQRTNPIIVTVRVAQRLRV